MLRLGPTPYITEAQIDQAANIIRGLLDETR